MNTLFAVSLLAACEACDELAKSGPAHPFADDAAAPFFTVQFDKASPAGNVCVDVPHGASAALRADDAVVVDGLKAPAGASNACLADASRAALEAMSAARSVSYRVTRAPGDAATAWDAAELHTAGLKEAVVLARFLLAQAVLADTRPVQAQKLRDEAEVLLDGAVIPN